MCVCLQLQLAEMEARVVGAETRAEIAEEKVNVIRFCWVFWLGFFFVVVVVVYSARRQGRHCRHCRCRRR